MCHIRRRGMCWVVHLAAVGSCSRLTLRAREEATCVCAPRRQRQMARQESVGVCLSWDVKGHLNWRRGGRLLMVDVYAFGSLANVQGCVQRQREHQVIPLGMRRSVLSLAHQKTTVERTHIVYPPTRFLSILRTIVTVVVRSCALHPIKKEWDTPALLVDGGSRAPLAPFTRWRRSGASLKPPSSVRLAPGKLNVAFNSTQRAVERN